LTGDKVSHYSATAVVDSKACFIEINTFKELIRWNGLLACEMISYICQEELSYFRRFVNRQQKQVNGRLADALLQFRNECFHSDTCNLPLTKTEPAVLIGTTRESATRAWMEFRKDGILGVSGKVIRIMDAERLNRINVQG